jgi:hypothetical protein
MKLVFSIFAGLVCAYLIAFSPSCNAIPAITAGTVQIVDCVENQIASGNDTFEDIAIACAPAALADVITIVTAEAAKADDGGIETVIAAKAKAVHHRGAK